MLVLLLLSAFTSVLRSQPATNLVLELDGKNSYVQLPSNIFNELDEATVEGWVKWDRLGMWMRFFDFGRQEQTMCLGNRETSGDLKFELFDANRQRRAGLWPYW